MSMLQPKRAEALSPRTALLVVGVFLLVAAGVITFIVKSMSGSSDGAVATAPRQITPPAKQTTASSHSEIAAALTADEQDYSVIVTRNLFQPLAGPAQAPPPKLPKAPIPVPLTFTPTEPLPVPPAVAFTGVVEIAGAKYALLENLLDHRAQYTRVGSTAFGFTLTDIAPQAVTLNMYGVPTVLNLGQYKVSAKTTPPVTDAPQTPTAAGTASNGGANIPGGVLPGIPGQPGMGNYRGGRNRQRQQPDQLPGEG